MSVDHENIDQIDQRILRALSTNARLSMVALGEQVGLSKTPVTLRVRRLEEAGIIKGYRAELDAGRLGLEHVAFIEVKLSNTRESALQEFNTAIRKISEVEACHMIAGGFDYLVKVRTSSVWDYRLVLGEKISQLPHLASTSTYVSMESVLDQAGVKI